MFSFIKKSAALMVIFGSSIYESNYIGEYNDNPYDSILVPLESYPRFLFKRFNFSIILAGLLLGKIQVEAVYTANRQVL